MRKLQPNDTILLPRGYSAAPGLGWPKLSSADSFSGLFLLHHNLRCMKIFTVRPIIEMTAWCGGGRQTSRLCYCNSLAAWDALIYLIQGSTHLRHKHSSAPSFWCLWAWPSQTIRYSTLPCIVDGLSWRLSNISAETAVNKMTVTKPSGAFELFFPSKEMQVFSLHSTSNS